MRAAKRPLAQAERSAPRSHWEDSWVHMLSAVTATAASVLNLVHRDC